MNTSNKEKIIFVIHSFNINGVLTQCLILAKYFKNLGYEVVIISEKGTQGIKLFNKNDILTLLINHKLPKRLKKLDDMFDTKLIVCESIFSYDIYRLISQYYPDCPKILRVHEEINKKLINKSLWQNKPEYNIREVFNNFNLIIFTNKHSARFYSNKVGGNKFTIIPITVNEDVKKFRTKKADKVFRILQLGTIYERKNPINTLIAFQKFIDTYKPSSTKLIFVGARRANTKEIEYIKKLKTEINKRNLSSKVKIVNSTIKVEKYISSASIITLHSSSECTPTVFLEANFFGKLFVSSNVGGVKEIVNNGINGYLYEYGDTDEQAKLFYQVYLKNIDNRPNKHIQAYYYNKFSNHIFYKKIKRSLREYL